MEADEVEKQAPWGREVLKEVGKGALEEIGGRGEVSQWKCHSFARTRTHRNAK